MLEPILIVELALIGICTGFLAGVLGIGGGMLTVPFVTYILTSRFVATDLAVKMAIATSSAAIIFVSISNVRAQHKRGAIRWDVFKNVAPGVIAGSLINSVGVFNFIKGQWLAIFFGLFIGYSAIQMLRKPKTVATKTMPSVAKQGAMGVVIGLVAGLVGAGGAFISVPYMTARSIPIHNAIATSAAIGMPLALFNALGFIYTGWGNPELPAGSLGLVFLPALTVLAVVMAIMAPLGVKVSHQLPILTLKRVFACLLLLLAFYMMIWQGLLA
jgi:uncharacterized membrane protein YfcA